MIDITENLTGIRNRCNAIIDSIVRSRLDKSEKIEDTCAMLEKEIVEIPQNIQVALDRLNELEGNRLAFEETEEQDRTEWNYTLRFLKEHNRLPMIIDALEDARKETIDLAVDLIIDFSNDGNYIEGIGNYEMFGKVFREKMEERLKKKDNNRLDEKL